MKVLHEIAKIVVIDGLGGEHDQVFGFEVDPRWAGRDLACVEHSHGICPANLVGQFGFGNGPTGFEWNAKHTGLGFDVSVG